MLEFLDIETPEFDYNYLVNKLNTFKNPRDKITRLLRNKDVIRVKKGIYTLGRRYHPLISLEVLANIIYGPS